CRGATLSTMHSFPTRRSSDLRDLDPVLGTDRPQTLVVLGKLERDRFEAVAGDVDALGEVHDVRVEHQLVVRVGLDEDDVDARVADRKSTRLNSSHSQTSYAGF